jgi:hypothetical protein
MTDPGINTSFLSLLGSCSRISIPLVQRDYAQGRDTEAMVRDGFLKSIHASITKPASGSIRTLNLDFIYGSIEENGNQETAFQPLDGQQRLTTLFLLHWYLAWQDGVLDGFRNAVWDGTHSRFTYSVRPSCSEFFDELVKFDPGVPPEKSKSIRKLLENQPWFFLNWKLDPTIQSALTMLDSIQERFYGEPSLYAKLADTNRPAITFQLLRLEKFGLSDDLYIKMNARGKPLTPFELFKARFEEHLKDLFPSETRQLDNGTVSVSTYFAMRMDSLWTEFFWGNGRLKGDVFDSSLMNLIWAIAIISLDPDHPDYIRDSHLIRNSDPSANLPLFLEKNWLGTEFTVNLMLVLDLWSGPAGRFNSQLPSTRYFDEKKWFDAAIKNPRDLRYTDLIVFGAYISWLREHSEKVDKHEFQEWTRVIQNLTLNSRYDHIQNYQNSLKGIRRLLPYSAAIAQYFAQSTVGTIGFSPRQIEEESLKAKLMISDSEWDPLIKEAESHPYFSGQIDFLLAFSGIKEQDMVSPVASWDKSIHDGYKKKFQQYYQKASLTFDSTGLSGGKVPYGSYLWQRALLAVGNYLVQINRNHSFLTSPASNYDSWKRFLRCGGNTSQDDRALLKKLWDMIEPDKDLVTQLTAIINSATNLEPWREAIVANPETIRYCESQEIRVEEGFKIIHLLKKKQLNGFHAELFTFVLHKAFSEPGVKAKLMPLTVRPYHFVTDNQELAYFRVVWERKDESTVAFKIVTVGDSFMVQVSKHEVGNCPNIEMELVQQAGYSMEGERLIKVVSRDSIQSHMLEISKILAGYE